MSGEIGFVDGPQRLCDSQQLMSFLFQIAVAFLVAVLFQKAILTNLIVFLFTLLWGCVGFTVLNKQLPTSLEWILSICSPFAFTSGMAKVKTYIIAVALRGINTQHPFPVHSVLNQELLQE